LTNPCKKKKKKKVKEKHTSVTGIDGRKARRTVHAPGAEGGVVLAGCLGGEGATVGQKCVSDARVGLAAEFCRDADVALGRVGQLGRKWIGRFEHARELPRAVVQQRVDARPSANNQVHNVVLKQTH